MRRATFRSVGLAAALVAALGGAAGCRGRRPPGGEGGATTAGPKVAAYLRGRILDRRGRPVSGAEVLAFAIGGPPASPARATTDDDGHFAIDGLVPGPYRAVVEAAGFPPSERAPLAAPADGLELRLAGEGQSIVGRVMSLDGAGREAGAGGATVELAAEGGGGAPRRVRAAADGQFAFGAVGGGNYLLRAVQGSLVSPAVGARLPEAGRTSAEIRLSLRPGLIFAGRVIDDTGAGVGGTEIRAERLDLPPGEDPLPTVTRGDAKGAFRIGPLLVPGRYRLATARGGYLLERSATLDVSADEPPSPLILELVRGARVSGRVVDARGAPVSSARVRCIASTMEDLTVQTGPLPLAVEAATVAGGAGRVLGSTRAAPTDGAGRFTVDDLIPGRYRLEVSHPGLEPLRTEEVTLGPGARREIGTLAMRAGFPVDGRVLDDAGNPIEGARVSAAAGGVAEVAELYALTDGGGNFTLALPAGRYRVAAGAPGHGSAEAPVEVKPDATAPRLELRLARAEALVDGQVSDAGGRPLGRARIVAWAKDDERSGPGGRPLGQTIADVGGHFRLTDLPAGELRIEVQHPDYPPTTLPATTGRYASLTVPFPGAVAGEAHVRSTGAPVGRGRVEAAGPGGARATAEIQRAGIFRLRRLVPGHWRLSVTAPGFRPVEQELDVPPSSALGEASVSGLRVELDPT